MVPTTNNAVKSKRNTVFSKQLRSASTTLEGSRSVMGWGWGFEEEEAEGWRTSP
ncbi:Hypothetical protein FKW44_008700 [Caligus rogercresseyi]|uniref:Uncharacterized protein n=1 Tax=Caligus rogercresseyi TaxID=217165 RepID=A0A7T8KGM3_CALRO|nr:Hypothetical protein FKW44_008700 [Caligus rogercresseyi]